MPRLSFFAKSFAPLWYATVGVVFGFAQGAALPAPRSYGDSIEVRHDIAFGESDHQKLDVFLPPGPGLAPVVICWFGGAFWAGDRTHMASVAAFFAANGFAAVTPEYFLGTRDGTRAAWPYAVFDAKAAVRFVRANAMNLKIDTDRIVALGYSSGAYLAMMVDQRRRAALHGLVAEEDPGAVIAPAPAGCPLGGQVGAAGANAALTGPTRWVQ